MAVTLIAILSLLALGQSPVEDGARALVRGDYRAASTQLRPLTQGPNADPAAQFLTAILATTDRSGEFNQGRACALFAEAGKSTHVFAQTAMEIADSIRQEMGPGGAQFCMGGTVPEYAPISFTLGPGHRIDINPSSIVVSYNGAEQRVMTGLGPGMVALPTRYTPLEVTRPAAGRRHFFQTFVWWHERPDQRETWTLGWMLSEVLGSEYLPVTGDRSVAAATGAEPPATFDVDAVARVFVNAAGDVEWTVGSGGQQRRGLVPPRAPK